MDTLDLFTDKIVEKTRDIHISLPNVLLESLDRVARERRVRRARLIREALAEFLSRCEEELRNYLLFCAASVVSEP